MVREAQGSPQKADFPESAPAANPVFFRTYSRRLPGGRETWEQVCDRALKGLVQLGQLTHDEARLLERMMRPLKSLPSGRWLWVGGTEWLEAPQNFSGAYNCTSTNVVDWQAFGLMMDLAMMGCGTGAVLEQKYISQLPPIRNRLNVTLIGEVGTVPATERQEITEVKVERNNQVCICIGDSRQGWVQAYKALLELSSDERFAQEINVEVDPSNVRPAGEILKGFGGVANPVKLPELFPRLAKILNRANGRQLNAAECCLLIDEAAATVVAGNIRRCLAAGTKVATTEGLKPIEEIQVGDLVLTSSGRYSLVTNKFYQGIQEVVEVKTSSTSIYCTRNHRVAVYDPQHPYGFDWKFAGELEESDKLISIPHLWGMIPSSMQSTEELISDGVIACLTALFISGDSVSLKLYEQDIRPQALYNSQIHLAKSHAHEYSKTARIPEFIWRGFPIIRAAFLAGLVVERKVLASSNEIDFLKQVQQIALSIGIRTTLQFAEQKSEYEVKIADQLSQENAQILVNTLMNSLRSEGKTEFESRIERLVERFRNGSVSVQNDFDFFPSFISGLIPGLILEVESNELAGETETSHLAETYDLEVKDDHNFIANGLLVHNSAGMRQFDADSPLLKQNLWQPDENGNWRIDPERDALRMANHTRVFHQKPTEEQCIEAVRNQYYSGEGAIQWAGETIARANADLLNTPELKKEFIAKYQSGVKEAAQYLLEKLVETKEVSMNQQERNQLLSELEHRLSRYGLNPCGK